MLNKIISNQAWIIKAKSTFPIATPKGYQTYSGFVASDSSNSFLFDSYLEQPPPPSSPPALAPSPSPSWLWRWLGWWRTGTGCWGWGPPQRGSPQAWSPGGWVSGEPTGPCVWGLPPPADWCTPGCSRRPPAGDDGRWEDRLNHSLYLLARHLYSMFEQGTLWLQTQAYI